MQPFWTMATTARLTTEEVSLRLAAAEQEVCVCRFMAEMDRIIKASHELVVDGVATMRQRRATEESIPQPIGPPTHD